MIAMALPTILLYEAAIYAVTRVEKAARRRRGRSAGRAERVDASPALAGPISSRRRYSDAPRLQHAIPAQASETPVHRPDTGARLPC